MSIKSQVARFYHQNRLKHNSATVIHKMRIEESEKKNLKKRLSRTMQIR